MTIEELKRLIKDLPPNMQVFIRGADAGADEAFKGSARSLISKTSGDRYEGSYDFAEMLEENDPNHEGEAFRGFVIE